MMKWTKVIENNAAELKAALKKAFYDAVDHLDMEFSVEVYPDGKIRTTEHSAGSTFQSYDSWAGKSLIIGSFCFQNMDVEITEEMTRDHMTEREIAEAKERADEEGYSFMGYVLSSGKYSTLISECEEEWKEWYKDEYALDAAGDVLIRTYEEIAREEGYYEI